MPQTVEAINHAKDAKVPIIVAVNKVDLPDANLELVKKQLAEHGLNPEEWGGTTLYNLVSALKNTGHQGAARQHPAAGGDAGPEGQLRTPGRRASCWSRGSTWGAGSWPRWSCSAAP